MCQTCTNSYKNIFTATCGNMDGLNEDLLKNSEISQYYNFETTSSNCNNAGYLQSKLLCNQGHIGTNFELRVHEYF